MKKIIVKEAFILDVLFKDKIIIYGHVLGKGDLKVEDYLFEDGNKTNNFLIVHFPMIRKVPFLEDHIHIVIKPILPIKTRVLKEELPGKTLIKYD